MFSNRDSPMPVTPPRSMARATCGMPQVPLVTPNTLDARGAAARHHRARVALDPLQVDGDLRAGHAQCSYSRSVGVDLGLAAGDQVGDETAGAAGHGPSDMTVAAIEIEVVVARAAEDRDGGRRHGAQAGPIFRPVEIRAAGEQLFADLAQHGEILGLVAAVVAGEFRAAGKPQPVAQARIGDQLVLVDAAQGRARLCGSAPSWNSPSPDRSAA